MRRILSWESIAALACAPLCLVPVLRWPAGLALLGFLPGIALVRHALGERHPLRLLILGGALSLASVPAVAIPIALVTGRPTMLVAVLSALAITGSASFVRRRAASSPTNERVRWRAFALVAAISLTLQVWMTIAMFPSRDSIRWKGLPDLIFFQGIYSQMREEIPPFNPENGGERLVHNWTYHFHYVLLGDAMGLGPLAVQRVASAWLAFVLLGLVYLLASEVLRLRIGATMACLFLMSSGEIYWLARALLRQDLGLVPMSWAYSPMGVTILMGWYNLAPLIAGMAAWYAFERGRASGESRWLWASVYLCSMMAFFHPIFYAVFMTAFCLWLGRLWLDGERSPAWVAYLLTPLPFFLLYKLPYYGWSMPPQVLHLDLSPTGILERGRSLALWSGILIPPAILGLRAVPHGFLTSLTLTSIALKLALDSPNPHWFGDLFYIGLALAAAAGFSWLIGRRPAWGWGAAGVALLLATVGVSLAAGVALGNRYVYSPDEKAAAVWLRDATGPRDLVAISPNSRSAYTVTGLANRRLVHGWTTHMLDFQHGIREQERVVGLIFRSGDPEEAAGVARKFGAAVVWVGPDERHVIPEGRMPDRCFRLLYSSGEISIFEPVCAGRSSPASDSPAP